MYRTLGVAVTLVALLFTANQLVKPSADAATDVVLTLAADHQPFIDDPIAEEEAWVEESLELAQSIENDALDAELYDITAELDAALDEAIESDELLVDFDKDDEDYTLPAATNSTPQANEAYELILE